MTHPGRRSIVIPMVCLLLAPVMAARAQEPAQAVARNMTQIKFANFPGLPTCALGSVETGDPATGPSIILAKSTAGCIVAWHWHTPNEHLMMVNGAARVEVKDGKSLSLRPGGFALLPSQHAHQFRCTTACVFYVYSDAAFDIHYVDAHGNEISPDQALKAVKEKAAKPMH